MKCVCVHYDAVKCRFCTSSVVHERNNQCRLRCQKRVDIMNEPVSCVEVGLIAVVYERELRDDVNRCVPRL
jgi:hypothetical protein